MISAALDIGSTSIQMIVVETDKERSFRVLTRWRFEERADLFIEVYQKTVDPGVELALASPARQEAVLK
jgi:hypothetical protein